MAWFSVSLLSPYLILPSLALSTSTFENTAILLTLMFASEGKPSAVLLALTFSTHLSISTLLLLLPVLTLLVDSPVSQLAAPQIFRSDIISEPLATTHVSSPLICLSVGGEWGWVRETWGASLTLPDLTPNPGLWWYFFTEMFDNFRSFFLMVFAAHLVIYALPICIKLERNALYASFFVCRRPWNLQSVPHPRRPWTLPKHVGSPEINPYLPRTYARSASTEGNANFYYAASLVMGVASGMSVVDACLAGLRIAFGDIAEGERVKWAIVQEYIDL